MQAYKESGNNVYQPYQPLSNKQPIVDETISYDEGWASRELDLTFPDVSSILGNSKIKGHSPSPNSSFDLPFIESKGVGMPEENERSDPETKSSKKVKQVWKPNPRRGPVYVESSDTDTEQKNVGTKKQKRDESAMEIDEEKKKKTNKRRNEDYQSDNGSLFEFSVIDNVNRLFQERKSH